ncbi:MAG: hypothetical protein NBV65_02155 [Burkholderiaceae bacterium]|nr:hypothetical protein [Burkholderiaceae bacterium]
MALATYSDLKSTVANYLARSDLTAQISDFIALAELRLQRDLRLHQMLKVATTTTTGGDPTIALPSDFLEMREMHIAANPIQTLTYEAPTNFYQNWRASESGVPKFYTVLASEFQFAPIPDTNYTVQMLYYARPQALSESNSSNVFLANTPDALLYAALGEAEPYLMNDARLQTWAAMYERALASITQADQGIEYGGQSMMMRVG